MLGLFREVCTVIVARMSHWKWIETKQQPSRARSGHQISCCLVLGICSDSKVSDCRCIQEVQSTSLPPHTIGSLPRRERARDVWTLVEYYWNNTPRIVYKKHLIRNTSQISGKIKKHQLVHLVTLRNSKSMLGKS